MESKTTVVPMNYEGLDDDKEFEMVLAHNKSSNNDYILCLNLESEGEVEKTFFRIKLRMRLKQPPQTTLNQKVKSVMKNLQTSHNEDASKIVEQDASEKAVKEKLSWLLIWLLSSW